MIWTRNRFPSTFDAFDVDKKGYIGVDMIGTILDMLGTQLIGEELDNIITEIDEDGNGEVSFEEFANLAARFLVEEDEDTDAIQMELKGAFRLYDREGNGFITTDVLREILRELDEKLTEDDLDNMIEEIDTDGSGTVDWDAALHDVMKGVDYFSSNYPPLNRKVLFTSSYTTTLLKMEEEELAKFKDLDISKDQLKLLKQIFDSFDLEKKGEIGVDMIAQILDMLGHQLGVEELQKIISEIDADQNGVMNFEEFVLLASRFVVEEEEDTEAILRELKDAFRLYDKSGLGTG
ncbi:hypothetical protein GEV33_005213 [Tenebrio molitor]|uniref:EF-hand domain-containing protein n=1 Tax=Tenebrio molitor TaxID=7067 RepID=A0A8J6HQ30_TENMO|nr:hypothetical protein GEV33_005213 [Tenebrio molitor]